MLLIAGKKKNDDIETSNLVFTNYLVQFKSDLPFSKINSSGKRPNRQNLLSFSFFFPSNQSEAEAHNSGRQTNLQFGFQILIHSFDIGISLIHIMQY
jgi:hypothetical protein